MVPPIKQDLGFVKDLVRLSKDKYYLEHPGLALVNTPSKIALWTGAAVLVTLLISAQFIKVKR